ncbi:VanZ family protein [uncultured Cellulomonas sp.]|uniref:VanZ family protein n=1 Tax=uncultured Cellulomonas sp. TaxID=189682 RepID=UPI0026246AC9|nr:VanZ family protein [uncultured Cellulomonas sp.]
MTPAPPTRPPGAPVSTPPAARPGGRPAVTPPGASPTSGASGPSPAPSPGRRRRRLPWVLALAVYTVLVALVVGWPTPVDANARAPLSELFAYLYGLGVPDWFDYNVLEKSANVAMFVPFGVLMVGLDPRRWWWGILGPAAASGAAELAQHVLLPDRTATWTDVAANTGGAVLGVGVALLVARRAGRTEGRVRGRGRSASTPAGRRPARTPRRAPSPPR